jgi:hypothetical protein
VLAVAVFTGLGLAADKVIKMINGPKPGDIISAAQFPGV